MGWLCDSPQQAVTLDVLSLKEQELQHEVLMLRRRIRKLLGLILDRSLAVTVLLRLWSDLWVLNYTAYSVDR